jgi:uncharacterized protein (DUF488 family)
VHTLHTVGYEHATVRGFLEVLTAAGVELLIDVRAVASSRRPGFAKTKLAANLAGAGIDYLHLRSVGTPADGRAAARAGRHAEMREIFLEHLATPDAREGLEQLERIVRSGTRACLLCLEADPTHCHRKMITDALEERIPLRVVHLRMDEEH